MESITYLLEHILEAPVILAWMESAKLSKVDRDLKREIYPANILNVNSVIHQNQLNNNWKLNPTSQRDNSKILSVYKNAPHRKIAPFLRSVTAFGCIKIGTQILINQLKI